MSDQAPRRRLAAILAADVVGYSRLMHADETGALAALKARRSEILQPVVTDHHGRIVKIMGDGVLIEFASAVNAVECAVQLQKAMDAANTDLPQDRRIVLRIGINLGDVMVEGGDLYGDGVNIAARLEAIAEPGAIVISSTAHDYVRNKVKAYFDDLGAKTLKNIAEPIRAYRVRAHGLEFAHWQDAQQLHARPGIAVLPFMNLSEDREQEYFSDGITEDIITELSRFPNLAVIARNSSFAYKGKSVNIGTIAHDLGVQYILEGSVRRAGQRLRITAQLIDAATGNHVWAERYDREMTDVFAVQDEVSLSIVGAMAVEFEDESLARARRMSPESLQAYDHWLQGKRLIFLMGQSNLEARRHFELAIRLDPGFSRAYSGLALTYQMEALDFPLPQDFQIAYAKSFEFAQKATQLDESNHQAHLALAYVYLYRRDGEQAAKHIERATKLQPSDGDTLAHASYLWSMIGQAERAIECAEKALRLNPHHPDWYLSFLASALFCAQRHEEADAIRKRAPDTFIDSYFGAAANLAQLGRLDEAKQWAQKGIAKLGATPGGALAIAEGQVVGLLLDNNPYCRQEDRDRFAEGMRKAGVPG
jgi:adenylate cyclase